MRNIITITVLLALLLSGFAHRLAAQQNPDRDSISYVVGLSLAESLTPLGIQLNPEAFLNGFRALSDTNSTLTHAKAFALLMRFNADMMNREGAAFGPGEAPSMGIDSLSTAFGADVRQQCANILFDIYPERIAKALEDVRSNTVAFDAATFDRVYAKFESSWQMRQQQIAAEKSVQNKAAGIAFMAENKKDTTVVVLPNGLQYKELRAGTGPSPAETDVVVVHYEGRLLDGKIFDSSYERGQPAEFPLKNVIPGWTQALQLMKTGAKWRLFIPSGLAYGEQGKGANIPPGATLIFDVELLNVKKVDLSAQQKAAAFMEANKKLPGVITRASGLQYKVLREGSGASPQATDIVKVHYEGRLLDGEIFDSSYRRNEPIEFQVSQLIQGWVEALQLMKPGDKWQLYIPPQLGYGSQDMGSIPPNSVLIFDLELLEVKKK